MEYPNCGGESTADVEGAQCVRKLVTNRITEEARSATKLTKMED